MGLFKTKLHCALKITFFGYERLLRELCSSFLIVEIYQNSDKYWEKKCM